MSEREPELILRNVVTDLLTHSCNLIRILGDKGLVELEKTETGARQCTAENEVWRHAVDLIRERGLPIRLNAEDHHPVTLAENPEFEVWMDLMDGTAGFVRNKRSLGEPVTSVIAITPVKDNLSFKDVVASGVIDIRTGEWWSAEKGKGAFTGALNLGVRTLGCEENKFKTTSQYQVHTPVHTTDPWRRVNGFVRFLWPQCHEVWNSGSVAMDMLLVALGEADLFYNGLPSISDEGQRGHELAACYLLLKEAGDGYALDMRTEQDLADTSFIFDGQVPVVMGVNQEKVMEFWEKIKKNFAKLNLALVQGEIKSLKGLLDLIPPERWSLD